MAILLAPKRMFRSIVSKIECRKVGLKISRSDESVFFRRKKSILANSSGGNIFSRTSSVVSEYVMISCQPILTKESRNSSRNTSLLSGSHVGICPLIVDSGSLS